MAETKVTKNEMADRNIKGESIRIQKNATQNITLNTQAIIQYNAAVAGYDTTLFELNSYGVKILSSKIKSVMVTFNTQINAMHNHILYVYNNTVQIAALAHALCESSQISGIIVPVSLNDIITARIYDYSGNATITSTGDWNFMTVTVLTTNE